MKNRTKKSNGFTLIELLIVVSLLAIAVGVTGDVLISLIRTYSKTNVKNEIEQNAGFVSQKLLKELRNAGQITELDPSDATPLQSGDSFNAVTFIDRQGNQTSYSVSNNIIYRNTGSGNEPLTENIPPSGIKAECIGGPTKCFTLLSTNPQVLKISISATQAGNPDNIIFKGNITIEDTVVIRDTY